MLAATTWKDIVIEFVKQLTGIIGAAGAFYLLIRPKAKSIEKKQDTALENQKRLEEKANRIEEKNDGNHKLAMEAIHRAGKYEGKEEAKNDARFDQEQILKAVEQVLAAQSQKRGKRRTDPP